MPDLAPGTLAFDQSLGGVELPVLGGIKLEILFPDGAEGAPALAATALLERLGSGQPLQQVAGGIIRQQGIEIVCFQPFAAQLIERYGGHFCQRAA